MKPAELSIAFWWVGTDDGVSLTDTLGPKITVLSEYAGLLVLVDKPIPPRCLWRNWKMRMVSIRLAMVSGMIFSLCIDGSAVLTYNLNDYYTPVAGDYTRGTVYFSVPELTEGKTYVVVPCLGFAE